jgi:hypothetical protein
MYLIILLKYLTLHVDNEIKQALENQPWIAKVSITADPLFFNRIKINIDSQQIAMRCIFWYS